MNATQTGENVPAISVPGTGPADTVGGLGFADNTTLLFHRSGPQSRGFVGEEVSAGTVPMTSSLLPAWTKV